MFSVFYNAYIRATSRLCSAVLLSNYTATLHLLLCALTGGPRKLHPSVTSHSAEKYTVTAWACLLNIMQFVFPSPHTEWCEMNEAVRCLSDKHIKKKKTACYLRQADCSRWLFRIFFMAPRLRQMWPRAQAISGHPILVSAASQGRLEGISLSIWTQGWTDSVAVS